MKATTFRPARLAAWLGLALVAQAAPAARAQVVAVTVGVDGSCPYGLGA